jgi:hypothetical protein
MTLQYSDKRIKLNDILLMQFDQGREIPSLLATVAKNLNGFDIQNRTMMVRMNGAVAARGKQDTTLAIGVSSISLYSLICTYLFGANADHLKILTLDPTVQMNESKFAKDLYNLISKTSLVTGLQDLLDKCAKSNDFLIICLPAEAKQEIQMTIEMFSKSRKGILFLTNYGLPESPSYYETVRNIGMRILELPDGSGELMSL